MEKGEKNTDEELERIRRKKMQELRQGQSKSELPDEPINFSKASLEDAINEFPNLVVDFWAEWCHPCRVMAPIIEDLAGVFAGKVVFGKVDVDNNREVAKEYGISSIPTLLFFKNGELMDREIGAVPKNNIKQKLEKLTGK